MRQGCCEDTTDLDNNDIAPDSGEDGVDVGDGREAEDDEGSPVDLYEGGIKEEEHPPEVTKIDDSDYMVGGKTLPLKKQITIWTPKCKD